MRNSLYLLVVAAIVFSQTWQSSVTSASNQLAGGQQQIDQRIRKFSSRLLPTTTFVMRFAAPRREE
jgi:hypothetical protein